MPQRSTPRTDSQVGNYRLNRMIGEGGMGQVYEAVHVELGRRAAVKILRPELAQNQETAARFFTEARAASQVQHPGMVHVYEYGHLDDGGAYIAMEYLDGESLRDRLGRLSGRMPVATAVALARQIAATLEAAHAKGIVHRDLKPDNVMLVPDAAVSLGERTKILDFGIAKLLAGGDDANRPKTRSGSMLGTPMYMAPEQCGAPGSIGPHTDVYALGAVLFEMLSGQPPFRAEEAMQLIGQHLFSAPPLLRSIIPEADLALDELLQRMLAKTPEVRPTMRSVMVELTRIDHRLRSNASGQISVEDSSQSETVVFKKIDREPLPPIVTRRLREPRRQWFIFGACILVFLIGLGVWQLRSAGPEKPVPTAPAPQPKRTAPAEIPAPPVKVISPTIPPSTSSPSTPKRGSAASSATPSRVQQPKTEPKVQRNGRIPLAVD